MVNLLTEEEGKAALRLAREAIETYLKTGRRIKPILTGNFKEKRGVFVSIHRNDELRGCIGHPYPNLPLGEGIVDAAISAATSDPRFESVKIEELDKLKLEVTVLTPMELIKAKPKDLPKEIIVGKHGLLVRRGIYSGLLLPQVPVEQNWDVEEFLSYTCMKASLPPDAWWDEDTKIYRFEGQIFSEGECCHAR
ncbi:MAG: TIGR00296 family protein [Methanocellales archaeon]